METIGIIGGSAAAAGAYLKWAVRPVLAAYRVGRVAGQLQGKYLAVRRPA